jgi:hypothetical protein
MVPKWNNEKSPYVSRPVILTNPSAIPESINSLYNNPVDCSNSTEWIILKAVFWIGSSISVSLSL